jgi:hypothetical protein
MASTSELLKALFLDLCAQRDAALATAGPLRAQRDAAIAQSAADLAAIVDPLEAEIAAVEAGLPDLMNQIAQISNALGGNTAA